LEVPINNIIQEVGSDSYKRRRKEEKNMHALALVFCVSRFYRAHG